MNKIKIRASSWYVYADDGTQNPPLLGSIFRVAHQDCFIVYPPQMNRLLDRTCTFDTFAEAVDYIRTREQAAA